MKRKGPGANGLHFSGCEHLTRWLVETKWGAEVIRDVLYSRKGERFYGELIERLPDDKLPARPTYAVVQLSADGFVEVFGPRHLRVQIVQRPLAGGNLAEAATAIDGWIWHELRWPFREVYYPSNLKGSAKHERLTVRELVEREQKKALETAVIEVLNQIRQATCQGGSQ